ncbi:Echinoderm microtubule-associated protein-like elp-1 [Caenorhabditis elegans]|uniref:Echinoderm microtubule-associated protein-like elp-1 n=1 Tax=Caenorhabditis elegans TaxID=6239 RepID=EMAL_CAEEL|nr:Echinoderm microtubule-associated protein-like elp-1 [Caenorhabditis elegans]O45487.1 RecName: Full=Echinoderm microtubule-associated protein-like elp-1 [Caenorhabditis elegans]CAB07379.1 Echinoderm microtubule-associated protein-like elp-1 [Caenorhabditis elegans]|eukprot:NP_001256950.1 Echinoderm microtubule-associated protein-like elp-1 [Caenorhabditis elegans]
MSISNGWSSSSIISDVLPEEEFEEVEEDELILNENDRLKFRVDELEKIVVAQRNEILLLQSSTVEILRRLQNLEIQDQSRSPTCSGYSSLPRRISGSKSSYTMSPSHAPPRSSHANSKSLYINGMNNNSEEVSPGPPRHRPPTRGSDGMVNVSVGKSARGSPMRKWVSTHDMKDTDRFRRLSTSSEASTSATMNPIVNSVRRLSTTHRQSSPSLLSLCSVISRSPSTSSILRKNNRTCQFSNGSGHLPIFIGGKTVQVPVPTGYENMDPTMDQDPPTMKVTLKHVYSYRGKDVRSNIEMLPTGELVFFSANLVVLMNITGEDRSQRIYHGHTCDVKCITLHPNKILVASGQSSCHSVEKFQKPEHTSPIDSPEDLVRQLEMEHTEAHVRIWDTIKLTTLMVLNGFEKGICHVAFSKTDSGSLLAVVDDSLKHLMSVWNWQKGKREGEVKASNDVVFECKWHPTIRNLIVLYGKGHFSFFNYDPATGVLVKTVATFEGRDKPKTVLSMCFGENDQVVTGDSNGTISIWDPRTCKTTKQAHSVHPGGVYSLTLAKSGKILSGGKDRMVSEWDLQDLVRTRRPIELPDEKGFPRVILQNGSELIIGTSSNTLLFGNIENSTNLTSLIEGDPGNLTFLLTCSSNQLITSSQCGTLRIWNHIDKKVEFSKKFIDSVECVDVDVTNTHIILGFAAGLWIVMNITKQQTIQEKKEGTAPITAVKFAPSGATFAVATKDPHLTIYRIDASKNLLVIARIHHIPAPIVALDFSSDSQYLRGQSIGAHLLFWTKAGEICDGTSVKDVKWGSSRVKIGFETALVAHSSNGQVTAVAQCEDISACGMENGTIRIYKNPVTSVTAGFVELLGHGRIIKSVAFSNKIQLFSCSPTDNSVFEWCLE